MQVASTGLLIKAKGGLKTLQEVLHEILKTPIILWAEKSVQIPCGTYMEYNKFFSPGTSQGIILLGMPGG